MAQDTEATPRKLTHEEFLALYDEYYERYQNLFPEGVVIHTAPAFVAAMEFAIMFGLALGFSTGEIFAVFMNGLATVENENDSDVEFGSDQGGEDIQPVQAESAPYSDGVTDAASE